MLWNRESRDDDLDRELRCHLDLEAEEQRLNGLSPEDARHAARRGFGSTALVAEQVREAWGYGWIVEAFQDLGFALRLLGRNRGFTTAAVVPLAFAIGCTACTLTLIDAVLSRSLGTKDPGRMAAVYGFSRQRNTFLSSSYRDFRDLQSIQSTVESVAAFVRIPVNVRSAGGTERMYSELVTGDYFRTAGIVPALGRPLSREDEASGAPPVALISYSLWETRYQKNPSVLGSVTWIDGVAFTIAGIMPRGYGGTLLDWYSNPSLWIPLAKIRQLLPAFQRLDYENLREMQWLMIIARLRPGASSGQLQSAANALSANAAGRRDTSFSFVALPSNEARFFPGHRLGTVRILWILFAVSAAALAIACFNLANLLLARATSRQKEIGVRLALGAGRFRLVRQFAMEDVILAGCACALGLPMAFGLMGAAQAFQNGFGLSLNLNPDGRALALSALAGLATAIMAGSAPAWLSSRIDLVSMIKDGLPGRGSAALRLSLRDVFLATQVACAMVALVAAGLVFQSLRERAAIPLGFDPRGVLIGEIDTLSAKLPEGERERVYRSLLVESRSETRGAALASETIPTGTDSRIDVMADAAAGQWTQIESIGVSDGYFKLLNASVISGREILPGDNAHSQPVAVLSQAAARLFWPGQSPIGRHLRIRGEPSDREVVGLVADIRYRPLGDADAAVGIAFLPIFQRNTPMATIYVRTPAEPQAFITELRRIVGRTAEDMPLSEVQPLEARVQSGLSQVRLVSQAIGAAGAVGVALALGGILAAGAYRVAQRKREISIRIAIGAEPRGVIQVFVARGLVIGLTGSAAGLLPAVWASDLLRASLRGVDAPGPPLFAISALALILASGVASWAAARRIAQIQPAEVLRMQ
jgi:predicted permease